MLEKACCSAYLNPHPLLLKPSEIIWTIIPQAIVCPTSNTPVKLKKQSSQYLQTNPRFRFSPKTPLPNIQTLYTTAKLCGGGSYAALHSSFCRRSPPSSLELIFILRTSSIHLTLTILFSPGGHYSWRPFLSVRTQRCLLCRSIGQY
jgi:hypothetical protein